MIKKLFFFTLLVFYLLLVSCGFMSGGTHGFIKGYNYSVHTDTVRKALQLIVNSKSNIYADTSFNSYNDSMYYVTFEIDQNGTPYGYTIKYGDYDDSTKVSGMYIVYAFENHVGGSEGGKDFKGKEELRSRIINVFEREVIHAVDSVLGMPHKDVIHKKTIWDILD